jgi:DNA-binding MarR family transcriptional regulator
MSTNPSNPYSALKQIFHEPNRLAIMSSLVNAPNGIAFNDLKEECNLTDGNLSRHLQMLVKARTVRIKKSFVANKPRTTIFLSDRGRDSFLEYLHALDEVLRMAADALPKSEKTASLLLPLTKAARA